MGPRVPSYATADGAGLPTSQGLFEEPLRPWCHGAKDAETDKAGLGLRGCITVQLPSPVPTQSKSWCK